MKENFFSHAMKTYWGSGSVAPRECLASRRGRFTHRERSRYQLVRKLGGPQSRSRRGGEDKNIPWLPPSGIDPRSSMCKLTGRFLLKYQDVTVSYREIVLKIVNKLRKNTWSYASTPQYAFMAWYLVKHRDKFILFEQGRFWTYKPNGNVWSSLKRLGILLGNPSAPPPNRVSKSTS